MKAVSRLLLSKEYSWTQSPDGTYTKISSVSEVLASKQQMWLDGEPYNPDGTEKHYVIETITAKEYFHRKLAGTI